MRPTDASGTHGGVCGHRRKSVDAGGWTARAGHQTQCPGKRQIRIRVAEHGERVRGVDRLRVADNHSGRARRRQVGVILGVGEKRQLARSGPIDGRYSGNLDSTVAFQPAVESRRDVTQLQDWRI